MSNEVAALQREIRELRSKLETAQTAGAGYYHSPMAQQDWFNLKRIPKSGLDREAVKLMIENAHTLDFDHRLNTSSYVNVSLDQEEQAIAVMGLRVNLADQTVYPQSYKLHDTVVNMIANLWHCPEEPRFEDYGVFPGAGTVGSTEGCLLAGLALKFRWRDWYARRRGLSGDRVLAKRPNLIISTCYQAAWEKLFKYMDVEPRLIQASVESFKLEPEKVREAIDEHTMGVVCIMGNHYGGHYDPVEAIGDVVEEVNAERGYQVGIHVDAASGGFIAPFQDGIPPWDFRVGNVLSISASGHKYGGALCGTGWIVWRQREDLSNHVAISVTYLGGQAESYTLNFSRPATSVYAQYYKLLHYGVSGYRQSCENLMENARFLRRGLREMTYEGKPRFRLLDDGDDGCLPVVTAMLNPECGFGYDDDDLQHVLSQHHWYVGSYSMYFDHPLTGEKIGLFHDADPDQSMFRIVVKSNLTRNMAEHLLESIRVSVDFLDSIAATDPIEFELHHLRHKDQRRFTDHC
ncbi:MAG: pyridoxal-dependent decarboxylase [Rhodospirillaceae bacterium]|nr:pyridoxal-dependent decarboxylase [Rhodospirillaceae bacterium]MDE0360281.1 pyridoxal-dependent decarboxylase [Rhodospirillaceae bacterium]